MPQLSSGGGDDLGANDEMISFKDEGEQEEKIQENAFTERDLADLKSSLVNESEINQSPNAAVGVTECDCVWKAEGESVCGKLVLFYALLRSFEWNQLAQSTCLQGYSS